MHSYKYITKPAEHWIGINLHVNVDKDLVNSREHCVIL